MHRTGISYSLVAFLFLSSLIIGCSAPLQSPDEHSEWRIISGPYLGQEPPGAEARIFAPGILSTNLHDDGGPAFSPEGDEVFFRIYGLPHSIIACMKQENGRWSKPRVAPFSGRYMDGSARFSPDGQRLYFASPRPLSGSGEPKDDDIWFVEKTDDGWSEPRNLGAPVNSSNTHEGSPSITSDGTLYFLRAQRFDGVPGSYQICYSRLVEGEYSEPVAMPPPLHNDLFKHSPAVSPDGSYMVLAIRGAHDGFGSDDLYVSFRDEDGGWCEPINLGADVNSGSSECFPSFSPDTKYMFFVSWRNIGQGHSTFDRTFDEWIKLYNSPGNAWGADIYWVSTEVIEKLRPQGESQ